MEALRIVSKSRFQGLVPDDGASPCVRCQGKGQNFELTLMETVTLASGTGYMSVQISSAAQTAFARV
jgi:hypothetical protein